MRLNKKIKHTNITFFLNNSYQMTTTIRITDIHTKVTLKARGDFGESLVNIANKF